MSCFRKHLKRYRVTSEVLANKFAVIAALIEQNASKFLMLPFT